MTDAPALITRTMVLAALKDEAFFKRLPEFYTLKPKIQMMGVEEPAGCSGCRGRSVAKNIMADFLSIMGVMDIETITRLKQYFGVDKLMYNAHDPKTGAYITKVV